MAEINAAATIKRASLFSKLPADLIERLAEGSRSRVFSRGQVVFNEGDTANHLPLVARGRVKVVKFGATGREVLLEQFGPSDTFGEVAVYDHEPFPATATAMEDETVVLEIPRREFFEVLTRHPETALQVIRRLAGLLRETTRRLRDVAADRVENRLARLFLALDERLGVGESDSRRIKISFTRQELAAMVGTTTETAIRILSRWEKKSAVVCNRDGIWIRDPKFLREVAEGPEMPR